MLYTRIYRHRVQLTAFLRRAGKIHDMFPPKCLAFHNFIPFGSRDSHLFRNTFAKNLSIPGVKNRTSRATICELNDDG